MDKQQLVTLSLLLLGFSIGMVCALIVGFISKWFVLALALIALSLSILYGHVASN